MAEYIKFNYRDIQTIIGLIDEIEPNERTPAEDEVYAKACQIAKLQNNTAGRTIPVLNIDEETGRLTIIRGDEMSEPTSYRGVAKLGNFFAVTDYYNGTFPTNVLLKFVHASPTERLAFESQRRAKGEIKQ